MSRKALPPILLVEDDYDQALLARVAWTHAGIPNPVTHLPDGGAAVDYLAGGPPYDDRDVHPRPALVLLDLEMPEKSGDEVIVWMRSEERPKWIRELPTIVLTGVEDPERLQGVRTLGADAVLAKVADPAELAGKLLQAYEKCVRDTGAEKGTEPEAS